jgi:hypothetical protein
MAAVEADPRLKLDAQMGPFMDIPVQRHPAAPSTTRWCAVRWRMR